MIRQRPAFSLTLLASATLALGGCSTFDSLFSSDKIDYRSSTKAQSKNLEVPPDLTQLARDSRYQIAGGVVSASTVGAGSSGAAPSTVAPDRIGDMRVVREGSLRWLVVPMTPEQLWPLLRSFWQERGFTLAADNAEAGVMETDWAENRAKLPSDFIRNTVGRLFDSLYSTNERDRFRTRVERGPQGTEIYISHRGVQEVFSTTARDAMVWQPRPSDPQLEGEMLTRLMVRLGSRDDVARPAVASTSVSTASTPARARLLPAAPGAALEVDETFDRAWRRLGLALDRSGFSVEDRDRAAGLYFVRYVDPKDADKGDPSLFQRLFGSTAPSAPLRYRIAVKAEGAKTQVSVLNANGGADSSENAKRIVAQLVNDLR